MGFSILPQPSLLTLPNELLLEIGEYLSRPCDLVSFSLVNRFLSKLLEPCVLCRAANTRFIYNGYEPGRSVLHWAASHGVNSLLQKLLPYVNQISRNADQSGAKTVDPINDIDSSKMTPLCSAALKQNTTTVELLLRYGANPDSPITFHGVELYAVHCAILFGLNPMLSLLLHAEADIEAEAIPIGGCLHVAAAFDKPESIRMLVEAGADLHSRSLIYYLTPIEVAYVLKNHATVQALLRFIPRGLQRIQQIPVEKQHSLAYQFRHFKKSLFMGLATGLGLEYWDGCVRCRRAN